MSLPPNNSLGLFDDLYALPSTAGERNEGCLLYFVPEDAGRIFYVHINRLLAHVGAFDPVHLRLLLCAKHTTAPGKRSFQSAISSRKTVFNRRLRLPTSAVASNSALSSVYVPANPMVAMCPANGRTLTVGVCSREVTSPFHLPSEQ